MKLSNITEGSTKLLVPIEERLLKSNEVFYNPEMELSRDISIAVTRILKPETFCDLLAGSGARGVRIANETCAKVTINDLNPSACELVRENLRLNGVSANVTRLDANVLLSSTHFDYIDIDPFGPPVRFLDSAMRSIKNNGILAVTATDTGALCGTYPAACTRKYDSLSLRTDYYNELGMRILISTVARAALRFEFGIKLLFSHCTRHYFRIYLQVNRGSSSVKDSMKNLQYLQHCFGCMNRRYSRLDEMESRCTCGEHFKSAGPVWSGNFADPDLCTKLQKEFETGIFGKKREALKIIAQIKKEQEVNLPFYDLHKVCKNLGISSVPMRDVIEKLKSRGFKAERTHFSGVGIRTNAGIDELKRVIGFGSVN